MTGKSSQAVTFLFTDIVGSTQLWEAYPEAMNLVLAEHDRILFGAIEARDGIVFKTGGDSVCAAFADAGSALSAALDAQLALGTTSWDEIGSLQVRMAVHSGPAQRRGSDYFGPTLNRVARLLAAGHGGQILVSRAAQALAQDALSESLTLRDLGEHRLKDLANPERVFQVIHSDLPTDFPPINSLENLSHNLPRSMTQFVGRERETAEIRERLTRTGLLTLTGVGGCGKTRLAMHVAWSLMDIYPDGVWFADLAPIADPALVLPAVGAALRLRQGGAQPLLEALTDHLRPRQALLILDNCEHVVANCARLAMSLLQACPRLRILATSREPLGVAGEMTYHVPPLHVPDSARVRSLDRLRENESIQLFCQRAALKNRRFELGAENADEVANICRRLDGIPLAIELAAARITVLPVGEISRRLDDQLGFLTDGSRTAPPRQQTLRATMAWSHDLLSPTERILFRRLAVFSGGLTLDAAESVCLGDDLAKAAILDLMRSLLEKSLVLYVDEGQDMRYKLLEIVREFAAEKLAESAETEALSDRHLDYVVGLVERAEPELSGPDQEAWLARLESDHGNIRAALRWAEISGRSDESLRISASLGRFWLLHGHYREGRETLRRALRHDTTDQTALQAKALRWAGSLAWTQGEHAGARELLEQSLAISQGTGDRQGTAATLNSLGNVAYNEGDFASARRFHEQSLGLRREIDDRHGVATSLNNLGNVAVDLGEYEKARRCYEESLSLRRAIGDRHGIAVSLGNLGMVALDCGRLEEARRLYEESLGIVRDFGDRRMIAHNLAMLACIVHQEGEPRQAVQLLGAATELLEVIGTVLDSSEQSHYERQLADLKQRLGKDQFDGSFAQGRSAPLQEILEGISHY